MLNGVADSRESSSLSELSHPIATPTQYNMLQDKRDTYYKTK